MITILMLHLAIANAVCYRMGGSGRFPRIIRPIGMFISVIFFCYMTFGIGLSSLLSAVLMYACTTTYFKRKNEDAKWFNWIFVGLAFSLSMLPFCAQHHLWLGFALRSVVCTLLVYIWSETNGNVVWEEGGRGFIPVATLPMLLIGA